MKITRGVAWGSGAFLLGWVALTALSDPWPDAPTAQGLVITKFGTIEPIARGEPTPFPSVRVRNNASGTCEVNVALGASGGLKPGALLALLPEGGARPVAVGEVLLSREDDADVKLLGWWDVCPPMTEMEIAPCREAADALERVTPPADTLGPEAREAWADAMREVAARRGCEGWTPGGGTQGLRAVEDY